jgi:hypothetical protein
MLFLSMEIVMPMQNKYPVFRIQVRIPAPKEIDCLYACFLWESRLGGTAIIVAGSHSHKGDTPLPIGWRGAP